ncbi:hypothetical protein VUR80DRAFT_9353 [Thermomyces stellatus]
MRLLRPLQRLLGRFFHGAVLRKRGLWRALVGSSSGSLLRLVSSGDLLRLGDLLQLLVYQFGLGTRGRRSSGPLLGLLRLGWLSSSRCSSGGFSSHCRLLVRLGHFLGLLLGLLLLLIVDVSPDVVQNEVSGRLFGKDERLHKFPRLRGNLGRGLADNLDDDVVERRQRVHV